MGNFAEWKLSKEGKMQLLGNLTTPQDLLARFLFDEDKEIRFQAARHPGVNPLDLRKALKEYPELQSASVPAYLMWKLMEDENPQKWF